MRRCSIVTQNIDMTVMFTAYYVILLGGGKEAICSIFERISAFLE